MKNNSILIHCDKRNFHVIERLCTNEQLDIILLGNYGLEELAQKNLPFKTFEHFQTPEVNQRIQQKLQIVDQKWFSKQSADELLAEFSDIFIRDPHNGLEVPQVKSKIIDQLKPHLINSIAAIEIFNEIQRINPLNLVIVQDDWAGPINNIVQQANKAGITTLFSFHGTPTIEKGRTYISQQYTVFGSRDRDFLAHHFPIDKNKIHVVGNPAWDKYYAMRQNNQLHQENKPIRVLLLSAYGSDNFAVIIKNRIICLINVLKKFRENHYNIELVIKIHPYGNLDLNWHNQIWQTQKVDFVTATATDLEKHIMCSDLIFAVTFSSTLIESALLGKPSFYFIAKNSSSYDGALVDETDCIIPIKEDEKAINNLVESCCHNDAAFQLHNQKVDHTVERFCYKNDGESANRMYALISSLAMSHHPEIAQPTIQQDTLPKILIMGLNAEYGGGVVGVCHYLAKSLATLGYQVTLVEPIGNADTNGKSMHISSDQIDGYTLLTINDWPARFYNAQDQIQFKAGDQLMEQLLETVQPNIVHIEHIVTYGVNILKLAKEFGCKVIVTLHDFWYFCAMIQRINAKTYQICEGPGNGEICNDCATVQFKGSIADWKNRITTMINSLNHYTDVITTASYDLYQFAQTYHVDPHKLIVQNPAVGSVDRLWHSIQLIPRPVEPGKLHIAFIGSILMPKGVHIFLEALKLVDPQWYPQLQVDIYGSGDPDYLDYLKDLASKTPDLPIIFHGFYNAEKDLPGILASLDVVVIPSIWPETFGMVVEEALAAKVPVITTRIGGLKDHFFDGVQGRLFEVGDINELTEIIEDILKYPQQLYAWQRNIRRPRLGIEFVHDTDGLYRQLAEIAPPDYSQESEQTLKANNSEAETASKTINQDYQQWQQYHTLTEPQIEILTERMSLDWQQYPAFHFLIALRPGTENMLAATLDTLGKQLYSGWGLSVIAAQPCPDPVFEEMEVLEWIHTKQEFYVELSQQAKQSPANWVGILESGDQMEASTLLIAADFINRHPDWKLIYCDEDNINAEGLFVDPQCKPDFNIDLLRSTPYFGSLCLVDKTSLDQIGGLSQHDGVTNYDLAFKIYEQLGQQAIGHIDHILMHRPAVISQLLLSDQYTDSRNQTIQDHLQRSGINAVVGKGYLTGTHQIDYPCEQTPLVSIIIPTRDRLDLIQPCINSLLEHTQYPNFEIVIVDNQSKDPEIKRYFNTLTQTHRKIRVIEYARPFNFAAINNLAAEAANGDYLLLLNNDTLIIQDDWLNRMVANILRQGVGVVGVRLVTLQEHIQHAGYILGLADAADSIHQGLHLAEPGYMMRAQTQQNFSAISAACMLVSKSLYLQLKGMNTHDYKIWFGDVDLCLRIKALGYDIVWTPTVTLVHHGESSISDDEDTQQQHLQEGKRFLINRTQDIKNDPAYNKHLTIRSRDAAINTWTDVTWIDSIQNRPHIMGLTTDPGGCADWRMGMPLHALQNAALAEIKYLSHGEDKKTTIRVPYITDITRANPDTLFMQAYVHDLHQEMMDLYRQYTDAFLVYTLDDNFFCIPAKNHNRFTIYKDIKKRTIKGLKSCDRLIVTTEPLREAYQPYVADTALVPNYLEKHRWLHLKSKRRISIKPRVGWAGAMQHHGDLELIIPIMEATHQKIDWIFFGMYIKEIKPYIKEFHDPVRLDFYPAKLATLNLDLAIAPLEYNKFNEGKSNLKILEYGMMGWPIICSDVYPYQGDAPVTRLPNNSRIWLKTLKEKIADLDTLAKEGDQLKQWVIDHWMLEDHLDEWLKALLTAEKYQTLQHRLATRAALMQQQQ